MNVPDKYTAGVDKEKRIKELATRKASKKPLSKLFPKATDKEAIKKGVVKQSKWTTMFKKAFGDIKFDKADFSKRFGIPLKTLDDVYDRGVAAWKSGGSRPGVPAAAWGTARLYKFILIEKGKAPKQKNDPDNVLHTL